MGAGESADDQAARSRRAAGSLKRKAAYAQHKAESYEKGAVGERMVAEEVAPLERSGWSVLHDRRHPAGGNIDHLVIGPPGIAVVDAKNWTSAVTITPDRRLVVTKDDHTVQLDRLNDTVDRIRAMVAADGVKVAVRGYLVLTGHADRGRAGSELGDLRIIGVDQFRDRLSKARGDLGLEMVAAISHTLDMALPPCSARSSSLATAPGAGSAVAPEVATGDQPSALFDKAHRFYYLRPWKKGGHNRLYLRNAQGVSVGWTDVNTGAMSIDCEGDEARFAEALLAAADPTGMKLAPGDLPKVATRLFGGRLLSRIARFHTSVLVGQEWRNFGKHRLYGTLIDPSVSTFHLGWVDLKTGEIHPAVEGNLSDERGPADRYLAYLKVRMPESPATSGR